MEVLISPPYETHIIEDGFYYYSDNGWDLYWNIQDNNVIEHFYIGNNDILQKTFSMNESGLSYFDKERLVKASPITEGEYYNFKKKFAKDFMGITNE